LTREIFAPDLLAGRFILVTGGGTGLGLAMVRRFMALGADVMICGRRGEVLEAAATSLGAEFGRPVHTAVCDVRDSGAVSRMMDEAFAIRPLDGLVNNAAANFIARTETLSARALDTVLDISMKGSAYCTMEAGKRWIAGGHRATVLSILTSYAWHGSPYVVPSAMAKAGILAMTRSLAVEWGPKGIRLVAISPGAFPTKGAWERLVPRPELAAHHETNNVLGRPGDPEELATLAAFLMSDGASYIQGDCVTIDGGRWLKGAGTFGFLGALSDDEWAAMKPSRG
jgi:NAD(P)-dependent dehydrogenase (short-subunit alcohol dehydrogenase family)